MAPLRWLGRSALRITLLIALLFFAFHVYGELRTLSGGEPGFLQRLELTALDLKFRHRGARPPAAWGVAVIGADEKAVRRIGRLPWSRAVHAEITEKLTAAGAAAVAFDMTFEEPGLPGPVAPEPVVIANAALASADPVLARAAAQRGSDAQMKQAAGQVATAHQALDAYLARTATAVGEDARFADALATSANVVIGVLAHSRLEADAIGRASLDRSLALVAGSTISELVSEGDAAYIRPDSRQAFETGIYRRFFGISAPVEPLALTARAFGTINAFPDADGVYRRVPLVAAIKDKGVLVPTLALSAVSVAAGEPIEVVAIEGDASPQAVRVGPIYTEVELGGNATLDWYGGFSADEMPIFSAADVLDGTLPEGAVDGRIAFVAATAVGTYDQRVTPFGTSVPGVVVHATLAQNLIDGRHRIRPRWVIVLELAAFFAIALICGLILPRLGALTQIAVAGLIALGWVLVDRYVLFEAGWVVNTVLPVLQVGVTLMAVASWRFLVEEAEKRKTKQAFRQYLSPAVMDQVLQNPEEYLKLGGKRCDATVLFSDIRGFTTFSEALSPEDLGSLLNRYMTPMTDLVFEHGGTLDKYIGDAVMAFWGAPIPQDDHAVRASRTALRMIEKVDALNIELEKAGLPRIAIGIGLSSGPMTIGNMGSADHFSYTALGDRVNLGARLEGQTKDYGVDIILSEASYALVKEVMHCRELGSLRVKGKLEPVRIYQLVSDQPLSEQKRAFVDTFHLGLKQFRARQFTEAIASFEKAVELAGDRGDKTSEDYVDLCHDLIENPPPAVWDGVRVATAK